MHAKEGKKKKQKKRKRRQITQSHRQTNHTRYTFLNNDDDCGVSRAVVVHRGERFGREILTRGDRRKRRRLVA